MLVINLVELLWLINLDFTQYVSGYTCRIEFTHYLLQKLCVTKIADTRSNIYLFVVENITRYSFQTSLVTRYICNLI